MAIVALKPVRVGTEERPPGTLVPEAPTWRNYHRVVKAGFVGYVEDRDVEAFVQRLCKGDLPTELAPAIPMAHLISAMRRLRGTEPPKLARAQKDG